MFQWDFGASAPEFEAFDAAFVAETRETLDSWLATQPDADALTRHLSSLEFALGTAVTLQDDKLLTPMLAALERIQSDAKFEELSNETLGALILLDLRAFHITQDARFEGGARRAVQQANARWDEPNAFFKPSALDTSHIFYTDANARLGEALYMAWHMLDDQTLRPRAGEVLGLVSDLFDANAGLYQVKPMPDGAGSEPEWLAAYSAAIRMFLAATATTERRTYIARACIVANHASLHLNELRGDLCAQFAFGSALLRLAQWNETAQYRETGLEILRGVTRDPKGFRKPLGSL